MKKLVMSILVWLVIITPISAAETLYDEKIISNIELSITPSEDEDDKRRILEAFKTRIGSPYHQADFDDDLKFLAKEYQRVEPKITLKGTTVDIRIEVQRKPIISEIVFIGNKALGKNKLEQELGLSSGVVFDQEAFIKAFHKLKNLYIKKGFFEAELAHKEEIEKDNTAKITIFIKEGRSGKIEKIRIHNLTKKERNEIGDRLLTKEYNFWWSWLTQEGLHNPEVWQHDELEVLRFLHNEGYLDAKVDTKIVTSKKNNRIILDVYVQRGPCYQFGAYQIKGNKIFTESEFKRFIGFKKGDHFSPDRMKVVTKAMSDFMGAKGYMDAYVSPITTLDPKTLEYNIVFQVVEGDRFRVGIIKVFGNKRTNTRVILHETLLVPGDYFNVPLLEKTEERLRNIGYFKSVNVYSVKSELQSAQNVQFRDVFIEVEENPTTAHFHGTIGFSTTESIFGVIGVRENNFNILGLKEVFKKGPSVLRGAGEYLNLQTTIGRKQSSYDISWTKPYFLDTPWVLGADFTKNRVKYASSDYNIKAYTTQLHGYYTLNAFMKWGIEYRLRHSFITLKHVRHRHKKRQFIRESENGGVTSAIGPVFMYDSRDSFVAARQGLYSTLSLEYAGIGGDHKFLKASYHNTHYWSPLPQAGTFCFRANADFIKTLGSTKPSKIPLDERFFAGGETSIRGYMYNSVGPRFKNTRIARGGMSSLFCSGEYTHNLMKKIDGFVFADIASIDFKELHIGKPRYSIGTGVKLKILGNVPITVGLGFPLNPRNKRDVHHLFVTFGASF